jgi:hypothetical protein
MYGIVPGAAVFSATEPKKSAKLTKFGKHSGRKLINTLPTQPTSNHQEKNQSKAIAIGNATVEELDKILEEDALALLNIKKEINATQQEELEKLRSTLLITKKQYDTVYVENSWKEKELFALRDQYM